MARLWSSGAELNSTTDEVEASSSGSMTIVTSPVRSGTYAYKVTASSSISYFYYGFKSTNAQGNFFFRGYVYITTAPGVQIALLRTVTTANGGKVAIRINSDMTLQLYNEEDSANIGSASSALSLNTWYRVELNVDTTTLASTTTEALIDGVSFASGTVDLTTGIARIMFGSSAISSTFTFYFDDIAVNDSTGSFQTSYPGAGQIIHLLPNATGDSAQWTPTSGDNYTNVDEVTPDDATTLVADSILNDSDLYNVAASGIGASDTVNVVQVGVRFRNDVADATTAFKVQAEKSSGGTIAQSSAITPNSTTWKTNATATPKNYPLTLHQDPDSSNWTQATLNTMQIGTQSTLIGVNKNQVSTVWALVDYTPAAVSPLPQLGGLFWRGGIPS